MNTKIALTILAVLCLVARPAAAQTTAAKWWTEYVDTEVQGQHVLGCWKFNDAMSVTDDSSSHGHQATMRGAAWHAEGRFGGCLESSAGYPVIDESHSIHVTRSTTLSPRSAFTVEMWIKPKPADAFPKAVQPVLLDSKYVRDNHTGFMFSMTTAADDGSRRLAVEIGLGSRSDRWYSRPVPLPPLQWKHIAFTYDARGTVAFFVDGTELNRETKNNATAMMTATRPLAIGDRIGSLYRGFPGFIDEVRLTSGLRDFQLVRFQSDHQRVFVRMASQATIDGELHNQTGGPLTNVKLTKRMPDGGTAELPLPDALPAGPHRLSLPVDTSLKPGDYEIALVLELPDWEQNGTSYRATATVPFAITRRPLPKQMPVVMWGVGGTDNVVREISRLKEIGFTHCLGLGVDYQRIWNDGEKAMPATADKVADGRRMLDIAQQNDIRIVASLAPARWLRTAHVGAPFQRLDRRGQPYGRHDVCGLIPQVREFCFNTGAAMARAYGDHPAFEAALLHTEVRGESQVSFRDEDRRAYLRATGEKIPPAIINKNGVDYRKLADFPDDRVIDDSDPLLRYYHWFWTIGDGWNDLNTRLHDGLKSQQLRDDFWTFYDPAARVPSIGGSGGNVDVLSHWTYSYPDPIRIGLCADELFEMTRASGRDQDVMKMTQLIWYRSQTAPKDKSVPRRLSPWVDQDPDADYITIAPMHVREAFWWKMARPVQGIMYHGWQSLVDTDVPGAYRYTNPHTRHELTRLINDVVVPLGPTLRQVPDASADVAFLESFTSQMFARRGTYGWNHTWAGDMYHILMYAQLQPRVLYEESLLAGELEGVKVLVMADCDVLTKSAVDAIRAFQSAGGIIIGDAEVCPAIRPDLTIPRFRRTKKADLDRTALQTAARDLREWLDPRYTRKVDSTNPDVLTRRRRFGTTDYIFAVNDRREFGSYVGGYGLVMEDGLPSVTKVRVDRENGHVYDLTARREIETNKVDNALQIPLSLGPCEGRVLMITEKPIRAVEVNAPESAGRGQKVQFEVSITDGQAALDAVVPVEILIIDPEGRRAEFSGYYGAANGAVTIDFHFAVNDRLGLWQIRGTELASGISSAGYIRLEPAAD